MLSRGLRAATVAPAEVIAAVRTVRRVGAVVIPLVEAADIRAEAEAITESHDLDEVKVRGEKGIVAGPHRHPK